MKPLVILDPDPRWNDMIFRSADWDRLHAAARIVTTDRGPLNDETVDRALPEAEAIIGQTAMPASRIERAPRLRAIFNVEGNFFPNIDYAACFARGIRVACAAPAFAKPVAEYALALALDLERGITRSDRLFRAGGEAYGSRGNREARSLYGAEVGVIGFGNIARMLLPLLAPFRCQVRAYDPWLPAALLREHGAQPASLDELLRSSRLVIVLAAATATNRHLIGTRELALLAPQTKLIVLSRADVVDFDALHEALTTGRIEAAIDVFPQEPVAQDDPLRTLPGVLLSAHRAGGLESALKSIGEMAVDDLELVLNGLPPVRLQSAQPETVGLQRSKPGASGSVTAGSA